MKHRCMVIVGSQWGDEGKGKIVDVLAEEVEIVEQDGDSEGEDDTTAQCEATWGPELYFELDLTAFDGPTLVVASTNHPETDFDTVVLITEPSCSEDAVLACHDDVVYIIDTVSELRTVLDPGMYVLIVDGFHGDTSKMFGVGKIQPHSERLIKVAQECLYIGIDLVRPGTRLGDIGAAIQQHAERHYYAVVRDYCGHGIGRRRARPWCVQKSVRVQTRLGPRRSRTPACRKQS